MKFLLLLYYIIFAGVQVSPEQKKPSVSSPASVTRPSNTSITDIIESVVSAAREDDTSKDSASSISKSGTNRLGPGLDELVSPTPCCAWGLGHLSKRS